MSKTVMTAKILQFKPKKQPIDMQAELARAADGPKTIEISWRCLGYLARAAKDRGVAEFDLINQLITEHLAPTDIRGSK